MKWYRALMVTVAACSLLVTCDDSEDDEPGVVQESILTYHADWAHSSNPFESTDRRGRFDWYTHRERVLLSELDPSAVESPEDEIEFRQLECVFHPYATIDSGLVTVDPHSYGSMTQRVGLDSSVTTLQFLVRVDALASSGWLVLDMGVFSEDFIPNGVLDTEDRNNDGLPVSASEDIGLDGMSGRNVPWPLPIELANWEGPDSFMEAHFGEFYDYHDVNSDGMRNADEPWSNDDFIRAPQSHLFDLSEIPNSHGGERNSYDSDQLYPDTEDLNGNMRLDLHNGYYRYRIALNPIDLSTYPFIWSIEGSVWYRVHLNLYGSNRELVGIPDPFQPTRLRMSLTGFTGPAALVFSAFRFH